MHKIGTNLGWLEGGILDRNNQKNIYQKTTAENVVLSYV